MKKLFIYSAIALSGFMLPACGEEDPEPQPKEEAATIEGKWYVTRAESQTFDGNNNQIGNTKTETNYPNYSLTFNAPTEFKEDLTAIPARSATGSYAFNNNELTVTNPNKIFFGTGNYQVDSLTATRLVFRRTIPATATTNKMIVTYRSKK